jgi:hypothetical protein
MDSLDTTGWTKPNGSPVDSGYWKILRGSSGAILRAVYEVPASEGFVVGDILIGGEKIEFGGQIAENITMKLTGLAFSKGKFKNPAQACIAMGGNQTATLTSASDEHLSFRRL